jgi:uncharacterized phage protein (TIGR02218 family)
VTRPLDPSLAAHLGAGATTLATCWTLRRADGVRLGFTDHDRPLWVDGVRCAPDSGADGAAVESSADLSVDNSEILGALAADALSAEDLAAGRYDGAAVDIWRVNWERPAERLLVKRGVIGEVAREGGRFRAEIRGRSHALDAVVGRLYQRGCDAVLGDRRCGVDLDDPAFAGAGAVAALVDEQRFIATGLADFAGGWFAEGALVWTGGANAGGRAAVKSHDKAALGDALALWLPPGRAIAVGDSFAVHAGCDKRAETCRDKFRNLINFRGFPTMPGDDFAASYPVKSDTNDGGRR